MKVVGFTFIRNAVTFDYPIVEAVRSILPLCNEVVVAVGKSDDKTLELIQSIDNQKLRIIETVWNDADRDNGAVLAVETNKAFDAVTADADWCIYIQGDECFHEKFYATIRAAMAHWLDDADTEGFVFRYRHFYGSFDYVATSRQWYRQEVRVFRNDKTIRSWRDAQGFRKDGRKLKVREIDAEVHHYGWVRHPRAMQLKQLNFNRLWHSEEEMKSLLTVEADEFDYSVIDDLAHFEGTHPSVFQPRIDAMNWQFSFDPTRERRLRLKEKLSRWFENRTGRRVFEYRNFVKIGKA